MAGPSLEARLGGAEGAAARLAGPSLEARLGGAEREPLPSERVLQGRQEGPQAPPYAPSSYMSPKPRCTHAEDPMASST